VDRRRFLTCAGAAAVVPMLPGRASGGTVSWARVFARLPPVLRAVLDDPDRQVQLIWLRPQRSGGELRMRSHVHGLERRRWFSPASVAKLPMALLMAERLAEHGLGAEAVIRLNAAPESGEWPQDEPLAESFARGLNRTFAVSENAPYNRWYEALGADAIHARLAELGCPDVRLVSRLGSADAEANRRSVGAALLDARGEVLASTAAMRAEARRFPFGEARIGRGWMDEAGDVIAGPRDVSRSNFMPLADSLRMLRAFVLPESVPEDERWRIDGPLRERLLAALALRPRESPDPRYDERDHPDGYARWFYVGDGPARYPDGLRVLGKTGMAWGWLSEVAHVHDADSGVEFMLAASIHCNADGIYNDDRYDYDSVGLPFLAEIARAVLAEERAAHAG